jgi:hypothetical protein
LALDDDRGPAPPDCDLRFDRVELRFERELFEPDPADFSRDFADRDPEVARAMWSLPGRV